MHVSIFHNVYNLQHQRLLALLKSTFCQSIFLSLQSLCSGAYTKNFILTQLPPPANRNVSHKDLLFQKIFFKILDFHGYIDLNSFYK